MTHVAPIIVRLTRPDTYLSEPCATCNAPTGRNPVYAVWTDPVDDRSRVMCRSCLRAGAGRLNERIVDAAVQLEQLAEDLRGLAGYRWRLPLFEEWVTDIVADSED